MSPITLVIAVVVALVVLIPTRRLQLAGWSRDTVWTYFAFVWILGVAVSIVPAPARFLVPILLVAYLAPFVSVRAGIDYLFGTRRSDPPVEPERPPIKNVTPPDPPEPFEPPDPADPADPRHP